ncbi:hypothetical protein HED60_05675 [Planctomycetales bacterium ZRK34]|nr:hypothetical protein HED60_05675 [Planctomycetales bacterium ZRK34]
MLATISSGFGSAITTDKPLVVPDFHVEERSEERKWSERTGGKKQPLTSVGL